MSWIKTWRTWHGIKDQTLYFDLLTTSITAESCNENENDGRTSPSFTFIHNTFVISLLSVHWVRDKKDETISSRGKGIDLISAAKFCLIFHEKRCASLNLQCQAKYDCVNLTPPLSSPFPPPPPDESIWSCWPWKYATFDGVAFHTSHPAKVQYFFIHLRSLKVHAPNQSQNLFHYYYFLSFICLQTRSVALEIHWQTWQLHLTFEMLFFVFFFLSLSFILVKICS